MRSDEFGSIPSKPHHLMIESLTAVVKAMLLAETSSSQPMLVATVHYWYKARNDHLF